MLNLGTLFVAIGVYFFKAPNHFATGGVSGISIIFARLFGKYSPQIFTQSNFLMAINILLLILGFIFLGKEYTLKTLYCTLVYSAENMLFERFLPLDGTISWLPGPTLTDQPFMELVYAMLLTGGGSAIMFTYNASSGGTDIIALILKKHTKMDTGKALLLSDSLIAFSTFFIFGIEAGLFSILGLFTKSFVIDSVIESLGKTKNITIITSHPEPIGDYILNEIKRDFTSYEAKGGYTGSEKTIMIIVCKRAEALKIKAKVKKIDPSAFTIITDAKEILGKGFRESV